LSKFVLDASVTVNWMLDDELDPRAVAVANLLRQSGAVVPHLWHLEVRNALVIAHRRNRIDNDQFVRRIRSLRELPVTTDSVLDLDSALDLATSHGLSFYDAIYLELANRHQTSLATLDNRLGEVASAEGIPLLP
jgi:predicted nucleic acid-binding protein